MGMGIAGAAIATVTGYTIPALIGLIYFAAARQSLWFVRPRFVKKELGEACLNGSSEMVTNLSSGVITFLFNLLMMHFAGEMCIRDSYWSTLVNSFKVTIVSTLVAAVLGLAMAYVLRSVQIKGCLLYTSRCV